MLPRALVALVALVVLALVVPVSPLGGAGCAPCGRFARSTLGRGQNPLRCCDYGLAPRFRVVRIRHMGSPLMLSLYVCRLWFRYPQQPAARLSVRAYASTVSYRRSRRGTEPHPICPATGSGVGLDQYLVSRLVGKPAKPRYSGALARHPSRYWIVKEQGARPRVKRRLTHRQADLPPTDTL
jgi:hypothetical protein